MTFFVFCNPVFIFVLQPKKNKQNKINYACTKSVGNTIYFERDLNISDISPQGYSLIEPGMIEWIAAVGNTSQVSKHMNTISQSFQCNIYSCKQGTNCNIKCVNETYCELSQLKIKKPNIHTDTFP